MALIDHPTYTRPPSPEFIGGGARTTVDSLLGIGPPGQGTPPLDLPRVDGVNRPVLERQSGVEPGPSTRVAVAARRLIGRAKRPRGSRGGGSKANSSWSSALNDCGEADTRPVSRKPKKGAKSKLVVAQLVAEMQQAAGEADALRERLSEEHNREREAVLAGEPDDVRLYRASYAAAVGLETEVIEWLIEHDGRPLRGTSVPHMISAAREALAAGPSYETCRILQYKSQPVNAGDGYGQAGCSSGVTPQYFRRPPVSQFKEARKTHPADLLDELKAALELQMAGVERKRDYQQVATRHASNILRSMVTGLKKREELGLIAASVRHVVGITDIEVGYRTAAGGVGVRDANLPKNLDSWKQANRLAQGEIQYRRPRGALSSILTLGLINKYDGWRQRPGVEAVLGPHRLAVEQMPK